MIILHFRNGEIIKNEVYFHNILTLQLSESISFKIFNIAFKIPLPMIAFHDWLKNIRQNGQTYQHSLKKYYEVFLQIKMNGVTATTLLHITSRDHNSFAPLPLPLSVSCLGLHLAGEAATALQCLCGIPED